MVLKKILFIILAAASIDIAAQETSDFFLYIPDEETMNDYLNMYSYLRAWDKDEINVDDQRVSAFFTHYVGNNTLQSLLFESFLRYTKNKNIQSTILNYINKNNINTNFTNSLKKLFDAVPINKISDERDMIQYNYNNSEYDENINLFLFNEVKVFDNELGLLLFNNDWREISFNNENNRHEEGFFLIYGGGTNSMTIHFRKYINIEEENIETKFNLEHYNGKYKNKWKIDELPLEGILNRAGADRIFIAHGTGPDIVETIESATFNVYLYNKNNKTLYEVSYFMNISPININFIERNRIFNFLFFQILFTFLN
jgi:hypothetical protein